MRSTNSAPSASDDSVLAAAKFVAKLLDVWDLEAKDAQHLLGFETVRDVGNFLKGCYNPSGRDLRDRIGNLLKIRASLASLFHDTKVEVEWLREPRDELGERSVLSLLQEGSFENLIRVRQFVDRLGH